MLLQRLGCGASPLLIAGLSQVISRIGKGSQNSWYKLLSLPLLTARAEARAEVFLSGNLPWCGIATAETT